MCSFAGKTRSKQGGVCNFAGCGVLRALPTFGHILNDWRRSCKTGQTNQGRFLPTFGHIVNKGCQSCKTGQTNSSRFLAGTHSVDIAEYSMPRGMSNNMQQRSLKQQLFVWRDCASDPLNLGRPKREMWFWAFHWFHLIETPVMTSLFPPSEDEPALEDCAGFQNEAFSVSKCSTSLVNPLFASRPIQASSLHCANSKGPSERPSKAIVVFKSSKKTKMFAMKTGVLKSPPCCSSPLYIPKVLRPSKTSFARLHGTRTLGSQEPRATFPHCMGFCFKQLLNQRGRSPNLIFFLDISAWFCVHRSFVSQLGGGTSQPPPSKWYVQLSKP